MKQHLTTETETSSLTPQERGGFVKALRAELRTFGESNQALLKLKAILDELKDSIKVKAKILELTELTEYSENGAKAVVRLVASDKRLSAKKLEIPLTDGLKKALAEIGATDEQVAFVIGVALTVLRTTTESRYYTVGNR